MFRLPWRRPDKPPRDSPDSPADKPRTLAYRSPEDDAREHKDDEGGFLNPEANTKAVWNLLTGCLGELVGQLIVCAILGGALLLWLRCKS